MTLVGLSFAYLKDRGLNTALNILLLALGVATLVILLLFARQLEGRFTRDAQGIDLVVGAKGSPLQLILSSIYHVDVPTGNIPLSAVQALRQERTVAKVIPLALGDNFRGYRIVGTEPAYPAHYGAVLSDGRMWDKPFEAVIGADVAAGLGAGLGQRFLGSHGLGSGQSPEHDATPFIVVGRLKPTGTVVDRLVMASVESVWDMHGIAHDENEHEDEPDEAHGVMQPEVTALLVTYSSPLGAIQLPGFINRQTNMQAAAPAVEITRLLSLVGLGIEAVQALALLLLLTAGLSIFVALYTALRQREGDMAMLRVIGASRASIFGQILVEGMLLATAGALLGVALGHGVIAAAAANFRQLAEMGLDAGRFDIAELWIVLGALAIGAFAALLPALRVFRADIAETLAHSR